MMMVVSPLRSFPNASINFPSVWTSSADVASSHTSIGASLRRARARATRWRWPPDKRRPRSPTLVWKPSSISATNSSSCAVFAASRMSEGEAAARP
mmetsp:Transcript_28803/g.59043  ORF Transcript_28803/g.59043 Transcript_28803/m.59043 type:complete len:96 (-) Transcript_28803:1440-1727(-)